MFLYHRLLCKDSSPSSLKRISREIPWMAPVITKHDWYWTFCSLFINNSFTGLSYIISPWSWCGQTKDLYIISKYFLGRWTDKCLIVPISLLQILIFFLEMFMEMRCLSKITPKCFCNLHSWTGLSFSL